MACGTLHHGSLFTVIEVFRNVGKEKGGPEESVPHLLRERLALSYVGTHRAMDGSSRLLPPITLYLYYFLCVENSSHQLSQMLLNPPVFLVQEGTHNAIQRYILCIALEVI